MCNGKPCGTCKGCSSNADGSGYDPKQIAGWITKYVDKSLSGDSLQEAYVKTMVYLEENKLPFTEGSISAKAQELKVVINDPDYLNEEKGSMKKIWVLLIIFGSIALALYFLFKDEVPEISVNAAPVTPAPAEPVPVPAPAPAPTPVQPVNPS
jgi:hypothetical protein